tara:strand:- start:14254 stop:14427 length:174 start_codon:yes stop_codon:yes gene_type:complete
MTEGVEMQSDLQTIVSLWPIFLGFITLVIVLAKMHSSIEVLREKVKTLFELWNEKDK